MLLALQLLGLLGAGGRKFPRSRTPAINPSRMDRRLRLERRTDAADEYGERVPTWETVLEVWAEFVEARGAERFTDRRMEAHTGPMIRIRFRTDIDETMRFVDNGLYYGIEHIAEIGRGAGLEIMLSGPE